MSASSGSSAASDAYKAAGASAQQVAQIQQAEQNYQSSLGNGGGGTSLIPAPTNKGYYDTSLGYYVNPTVSDAQRTSEAINYYKQNNMTDKVQSALDYSVSKGYTPSFTDYAYKNNIGYSYDGGKNTLSFNGQTYNNGSIPGLTLINGRNYVTDASLLPTAKSGGDLIPEAPVAQPDLSTLLLERINNIQEQQVPAPVYQPYQQREFQYSAPSYSITSNPADTSFIPTAKAKDRWQQQEQANADEAYKGYSSQYNAYQQGYKNTQDAIANALSLLPYSEMTAAQKATIDKERADAILENEINKAKNELEANKWVTEKELKEAQTQKALRDAGAPHSKGGGGGKDPKPTKDDYMSAIMNSSAQYKTAKDYKADLQRYKADLVSYVGLSNWNALYEDAGKMSTKVNPNFVSGTKSPIKALLGS